MNTSAGVGIYIRHHHRAQHVPDLQTHRTQGVNMHYKGGQFLLAEAYFHDNVGLNGDNTNLFMTIVGHAYDHDLPLMLVGDFNLTPTAFIESGLLDKWNLHILQFTGGGEPMTCTTGARRCLDYVIVSESLLPLTTRVSLDWAVPFGPHCLLRWDMATRPATVLVRTQRRARPIPPANAGTQPWDWQTATQYAIDNVHKLCRICGALGHHSRGQGPFPLPFPKVLNAK